MTAINNNEVITLAVVAPARRGKTALIAAWREVARARHIELAGRSYELGPLDAGHGLAELDELARRQLDDAVQSLADDGRRGFSSDGFYNYQTTIVGPGGRRKTVVMLDAIGEALWPLDGGTGDRDSRIDYPSLRRRYEDLELVNAEHVLMLLVNEPPWPSPEWQPKGAAIPAQLAGYIRGIPFSRVVLLVTGGDRLGISPGDLEATLADYNRDAELRGSTSRLAESGRSLARSFVQTLEHECRVADTQFAVFWCSAKGAGAPPHWRPIEVARPLIWAAGFAK